MQITGHIRSNAQSAEFYSSVLIRVPHFLIYIKLSVKERRYGGRGKNNDQGTLCAKDEKDKRKNMAMPLGGNNCWQL